MYTGQPRVIYIKEGCHTARGDVQSSGMLDLTVLSNRDRGEFRKIMRRPHSPWWKGKVPLAEWFAEAYAWCARYSKIASVAEYAIYDYDPTPGRCADEAPQPPPEPPVVTRDPAPPAFPRVTPVLVPGNPARDPGPTVLESPSATAAGQHTHPHATPTPTPEPTEVPTATPTAADQPSRRRPRRPKRPRRRRLTRPRSRSRLPRPPRRGSH